MDCPVCREPMIVLELDEVEIDHCPHCRGIWLDGGELELLLDGAEGKDKLLASLHQESKTKEVLRKCPICRKTMLKIACGEETDILVDKCRKNDGIWFDSGELEKALALGSFGHDNRVIDLLHNIFRRRSSV